MADAISIAICFRCMVCFMLRLKSPMRCDLSLIKSANLLSYSVNQCPCENAKNHAGECASWTVFCVHGYLLKVTISDGESEFR